MITHNRLLVLVFHKNLFSILPQNHYPIIITTITWIPGSFIFISSWNEISICTATIASFLRTNVLLQNELPELPTLQRDGVRNVIFLRTPPFPKMSSLLFINNYSRWSLINTLENVVLLSQVPPSLAGPCCSTTASCHQAGFRRLLHIPAGQRTHASSTSTRKYISKCLSNVKLYHVQECSNGAPNFIAVVNLSVMMFVLEHQIKTIFQEQKEPHPAGGRCPTAHQQDKTLTDQTEL